MIKKISILIVMLLIAFSTTVFAGDIPEAIMMGDQQALFIGKITDINTDTITIVPSTIMMGSINYSEVKVKKFNRYYGVNDVPKTNDFVVAVLLDENTIDETWIFKCSSENYKTLKLISKQYDMVTRYESYINEGKYFEAQKKIDGDKDISVATNISPQKPTLKENPPKISSSLISILIFPIVLIGSLIVKTFKKRHS